jgi:glycosyltransferase involved in cell wall biosynthesis
MSFSSARSAGADALAARGYTLSHVGREGGIAIVLHDLRGGGAERACLRLARGMVQTGETVNLVLVRGEGAYLADVPPGVTLSVLDAPRVVQAIVPLAFHIRATRPRAVLSALTHMNVAAIAAVRLSATGARIVVSERNQISSKARAAQRWTQRGLYRAVPAAYRLADKVIAVSKGVAEDLVRFGRLPAGKVGTIHNPVFEADLDVYSGADPSHPWFMPGNPPVVLAVGRLHSQKGFDVLLDAFAHVRSKMECRLVILGEGEERGRLEAQAKALNLSSEVDLPGFCTNPFALMARAGCFVLSSRWEGFPNALVEAMACGAPVVATNCPSGPLEIMGGLAPLVPVDDSYALSEAILTTLRNRPAGSGLRVRATEFSVAAATARYMAVMEGR